MPGYDIRRAVPEEAAALCNLVHAAYQPYRDRGVELPDVTDGLADEIEAGRVWVAAGAEGVLGYLNLTVTPPKAHLMNVAVAPNAKGKGVGGALIRHAIDLSADAGCTSLDLATHRDLVENIALYEHLGWIISDQDEWRVFLSRTL